MATLPAGIGIHAGELLHVLVRAEHAGDDEAVQGDVLDEE